MEPIDNNNPHALLNYLFDTFSRVKNNLTLPEVFNVVQKFKLLESHITELQKEKLSINKNLETISNDIKKLLTKEELLQEN